MNFNYTKQLLQIGRTSALVLVIAALSACATPQTDPDDSASSEFMPENQLADTQWQAEMILDRNADAAASTLIFLGPDKVGGSAACNNFNGSVSINGGSITFGLLATTRMMCAPAISGQEVVFLEALGAARTWQHIGSTLVLQDENNATLMRLQQQEQNTAE
jgi:heat shock protein HslJ